MTKSYPNLPPTKRRSGAALILSLKLLICVVTGAGGAYGLDRWDRHDDNARFAVVEARSKDIVPREEHRQHWEAEDKQFEQLQKRVDETHQEVDRIDGKLDELMLRLMR